jgi:hypothetical protein
LRNELTLPLRPPGCVFDIVFVAQQDLSAQFAWVTQQSLTFAGDWGDFGRGTATPADATGARDAMVKSAAMRLSVLVFIFFVGSFSDGGLRGFSLPTGITPAHLRTLEII